MSLESSIQALLKNLKPGAELESYPYVRDLFGCAFGLDQVRSNRRFRSSLRPDFTIIDPRTDLEDILALIEVKAGKSLRSDGQMLPQTDRYVEDLGGEVPVVIELDSFQIKVWKVIRYGVSERSFEAYTWDQFKDKTGYLEQLAAFARDFAAFEMYQLGRDRRNYLNPIGKLGIFKREFLELKGEIYSKVLGGVQDRIWPSPDNIEFLCATTSEEPIDKFAQRLTNSLISALWTLIVSSAFEFSPPSLSILVSLYNLEHKRRPMRELITLALNSPGAIGGLEGLDRLEGDDLAVLAVSLLDDDTCIRAMYRMAKWDFSRVESKDFQKLFETTHEVDRCIDLEIARELVDCVNPTQKERVGVSCSGGGSLILAYLLHHQSKLASRGFSLNDVVGDLCSNLTVFDSNIMAQAMTRAAVYVFLRELGFDSDTARSSFKVQFCSTLDTSTEFDCSIGYPRFARIQNREEEARIGVSGMSNDAATYAHHSWKITKNGGKFAALLDKGVLSSPASRLGWMRTCCTSTDVDGGSVILSTTNKVQVQANASTPDSIPDDIVKVIDSLPRVREVAVIGNGLELGAKKKGQLTLDPTESPWGDQIKVLTGRDMRVGGVRPSRIHYLKQRFDPRHVVKWVGVYKGFNENPTECLEYLQSIGFDLNKSFAILGKGSFRIERHGEGHFFGNACKIVLSKVELYLDHLYRSRVSQSLLQDRAVRNVNKGLSASYEVRWNRSQLFYVRNLEPLLRFGPQLAEWHDLLTHREFRINEWCTLKVSELECARLETVRGAPVLRFNDPRYEKFMSTREKVPTTAKELSQYLVPNEANLLLALDLLDLDKVRTKTYQLLLDHDYAVGEAMGLSRDQVDRVLEVWDRNAWDPVIRIPGERRCLRTTVAGSMSG